MEIIILMLNNTFGHKITEKQLRTKIPETLVTKEAHLVRIGVYLHTIHCASALILDRIGSEELRIRTLANINICSSQT